MRVGVAIIAWLCLLTPGILPAAEQSPLELYGALNALRVDPAAVYQIAPANRIELRRGDLQLSFDEGNLAFFASLNGRTTGAVFSGHGHALALPRDPVEKQQMARFLGAPVLDQEFISAYIRFTDDTSGELLRQLRNANLSAQTDGAFAARWDPLLAKLNPSHSLRILFDSFSQHPKPYFFASIDGLVTGAFDALFDLQRSEQMFFGQSRRVGNRTFFDVWASYAMPDAILSPVAFRALQYTIDTSVFGDNSLDGSANVRVRTEISGERLLVFQLSRALNADSVTYEQGIPLLHFQNEGMRPEERSVRGNDYLYVVLPAPARQGDEFALHFHYRGNVIEDAGNGVLFVGARETWYPHLGDQADFASYDLTMRWPHRLKLVATGTKIEEHEAGELRVGRWKTDKPVSVAGFNLGDYASTSVASETRSVDLYANRQLEQALSNRLAGVAPQLPPLPLPPFSRSAGRDRDRTAMQPVTPSPADALKQLGKVIDSSVRFCETFSGPFPFRSLSVSQIPGAFGQGWPGLLYLSTFSFLPAEAQQRAGLTQRGQEQFTDLVPFHEVAHQWWGNIVGWSSYRDQWINEAIANYLALLFADSRKPSEHAARIWLDRYRKQLLEKRPGAEEPAGEIGALALGNRLTSSKSPEGFEQVIYSKGSWVVHMLREMLRQPGAKNPDARFTALLRALAAKYAYRALSTKDLQHEVEAVMTPEMDLEGGRSMEWFFEEWVRGTGIPHYRVEYTAHRTEKGYLVRGKLFQTGVPRSFITAVPLYADSGAGQYVGTVVAAGPETAFHFVTQTSPRKLVMDPHMTLLWTTE